MPEVAPFGSLLSHCRLAAGLSQADLAMRTGLSVRGISDLERGIRRAPRRDTIQRLMEALGLGFEERDRFEAAVHRYRMTVASGGVQAVVASQPRSQLSGLKAERSLATLSHILQAQPARLLGRANELDAIQQRLLTGRTRLITLTGPAGVGKTRLALEAGACVADKFPGGVALVDLAPVRHAPLVLATIAQTLGITHLGSSALLDRLREYLQDRKLLLILDNFEQVLPAGVDLVDLLISCPAITILITSRSPLSLQWEQTVPVSPLPVPDLAHALSPWELSEIPSVALFVQRARARQPDFAVTDENAPLLAELCVRLDGLPLAIELAAARTNVLPLPIILGRLEHRLQLLEWDAQDLPDRHRSLHAAIDWSYELLTESDRFLFRHLGVFAGRVPLNAIASVVGEENEVRALISMASLTEKSLVLAARQEDEAEPYFGILETVREYAWEQLDASGELACARTRHALYFLNLAERSDPLLRRHGQLAWFLRLEQEHDNIRAALRWLLDHDRDAALRLAAALGYFWWARGYLTEAARWLDEALRGAVDADPAIRARALLQAGLILPYEGDYEQSKVALEEALAIAQARCDHAGVAQALTYLGARAAHAGEWDESVRLLTKSLVYWKELDDHFQIGFTLFFLGMASFMQGDYARAAELQSDAVAQHRVIGDMRTSGATHFYLALAVRQLGDVPQAVMLIRDGLEVSITFQNRWLVSIGVEAVLLLVGDRSRAERRAQLLGAGDALRHATGFTQSIWGRAEHDQSIPALRKELDREGLGAAYRAGQSLSLPDVVALALDMLEECSRYPEKPKSAREKPSGSCTLSTREQEVLRLVAEGLTNKAIGQHLFVSPSTVSYHLTSIFNKLGVDSRAQAVAAAVGPDCLRRALSAD